MFDSSFYETTGTSFFSAFLGMREKRPKRWTTPGGGQQHAMPNVWESLPPSTPLYPSSSCLQLSVGRSVISRPSALSGSAFRRNDHWFQELAQEPQQLKFILRAPQPPTTTLLSSHFPVPSPLFSEISSSFWLLRRRQHRDELSPETSVFVQLAQSSPASPYLSLSTETVHRR